MSIISGSKYSLLVPSAYNFRDIKVEKGCKSQTHMIYNIIKVFLSCISLIVLYNENYMQKKVLVS